MIRERVVSCAPPVGLDYLKVKRFHAIFRVMVPVINEWYYRSFLYRSEDEAPAYTWRRWLSEDTFIIVYQNEDGETGRDLFVRGTSISVYEFVGWVWYKPVD